MEYEKCKSERIQRQMQYDLMQTVNTVDAAAAGFGIAKVGTSLATRTLVKNGCRQLAPNRGAALRNLASGEVPFDPAKLAKIQANLERRGVTFVTGEEGGRLTRALGGEAAYIPDLGKPGIIAFGPNPSRTAVVEELMHLGQHRNLGWRAIDNVVPLEIQAQHRLLDTGRRLGWSTNEMGRIQGALEYWRTQE